MKQVIVLFLMALLPASASAITPPGSTAHGQVNGSVSEVKDRAQAVFRKMGIQRSGSSVDKSGDEQMLKGKKGDLNVEVDLGMAEDAPGQTKIEVTAKKEGALTWNNDYARKILRNIIAAG